MHSRLGHILAIILAGAGLVFAQATASINGRIVDQGGAVAPGVNVTVTNVASGAGRQAVTNAEGLYEVAALVSGNYSVKAELKGFAPLERTVELLVGSTLTVDLQLQVGTVQESVSVEAQAQLIESTQGTIAGSIRTQEVQELPILNRTLSALMTLAPGARETTASTSSHGTSSNFVSFGGSAGVSYNMQVDGLNNKEDHCGGTEIPYSLEGVQEFRVQEYRRHGGIWDG
jgi:Carboxypeptidase regulatory-like domain